MSSIESGSFADEWDIYSRAAGEAGISIEAVKDPFYMRHIQRFLAVRIGNNMFKLNKLKDYWLIMDDSVNITSLIVNNVKEAELKLIPEKSRKRHLKEYELFNVVNVVCVFLIFFCTHTEKTNFQNKK